MTGDYIVATFTRDHPLAQDDRFFHLGCKLLEESMRRFPQGLSHDEAANLEEAVVLRLVRIAPTEQLQVILDLLPPELRLDDGKDISVYFQSPAEYESYDVVYFLNELAARMYREGGVQFEPLKTISGDQLPEQSQVCLSGPYIPMGGLE
jgi:hypothetical protein